MAERPSEEVTRYFMQVTSEKFAEVKERLDRIDHKMEQLIGFRWMMIGMATAVSAIVGIITQIVIKAYK